MWKLRFQGAKKIEEVQEFFLRIYPHTQLGGAKRVVSVYYRGELAAAGYPDGELSANSSSGGESDNDSVDSVSDESTGSNSDDEAGRETENPSPSDPVSAIGLAVSQPIVQGRRGKTTAASVADTATPAVSSSVEGGESQCTRSRCCSEGGGGSSRARRGGRYRAPVHPQAWCGISGGGDPVHRLRPGRTRPLPVPSRSGS